MCLNWNSSYESTVPVRAVSTAKPNLLAPIRSASWRCRVRTLTQSALTISLAAALLVACGGSQPPIGAAGAMPQFSKIAGHSLTDKSQKTFSYTGGEQTFVVPSHVTRITVTAMGASGASDGTSGYGIAEGGRGGLIQATVPVKSGDKLAVYVGGSGTDGGFNGGALGGGNTGDEVPPAGNGGGASDVRIGGNALKNRIVVAGGGGGGAGGGSSRSYPGGNGGKGGGIKAGKGAAGTGFSDASGGGGGGGGRQTVGGKGGPGGKQYGSGFTGCPGLIGTFGAGGSSCQAANWAGGGGGGGGYYGGGGGGQGGAFCTTYCNQITVAGGGGGGGGSSYAVKTATGIVSRRGAGPVGDGKIVISW
jgi:Glycine rich protein